MPVTIAQLRATTSVDLMTAALALGMGRTKAYDLARRRYASRTGRRAA